MNVELKFIGGGEGGGVKKKFLYYRATRREIRGRKELSTSRLNGNSTSVGTKA